MHVNLDLLLLLLNSLLTISCGILLFYLLSIRKLQKNIFYYGWATGFIFYGLQIFMRVLKFNTLLTSIPMTIAFITFQFSTWFLDKRKKITLLFMPFLASYLIMILLFAVKLVQVERETWIAGSTLLYLPVTLLIVAHRKMFGNCVDKLLVGWFLLFLINVLMPLGGWIADTIAIFSKILIITGIISYDFAIVTQKIRREIITNTYPFAKGNIEEGGFQLVMFRSKSEPPLKTVSSWLKSKVEENIQNNIETYIIVLQNVLPYSMLRSLAWSKPGLVHSFIFSQYPKENEEFTTINFGETELGATITEITRKHKRKKEIILIDLSILIHSFDSPRTYNFLLSKMGLLRSSGTMLTAVFHPETHGEKTIALFKSVADNIIQI